MSSLKFKITLKIESCNLIKFSLFRKMSFESWNLENHIKPVTKYFFCLLPSKFYSTTPDIFLTPLLSQPSAQVTYPPSTPREKYWIIFRVRKSAVAWLNCIIKNTKESARRGLSNTIQFLTAISSSIPAKLSLKLEACLSPNLSVFLRYLYEPHSFFEAAFLPFLKRS